MEMTGRTLYLKIEIARLERIRANQSEIIHKWLDEIGVPFDPYPNVTKECRIECRLNYLRERDAEMEINEYRIGTLKRCEVEISDVIETEDLTPEAKDNLQNLVRQIKTALGELPVPRTK